LNSLLGHGWPLPFLSLLTLLVAQAATAQSPGAEIQLHQQIRHQAQQELVTKIKQSRELARPDMLPEERRTLEDAQAEALRDQRQRAADQQRRRQQLEQAARQQPGPEQERQLELQRQGFEREPAPLLPVPAPGLTGKAQE